jgi:6-pyruvoyltetrahydropterin/6-carboxytetrahydropterin synthase
MIFITKEFRFDSAHKLPFHKGECGKVHGHGYVVHITLRGPINDEGMLMDFAVFKRIVEDKIINYLDHGYLNDLISNPTAENIAVWIYRKLAAIGLGEGIKIHRVKLWETPGSYVEYYPQYN